MKVAAVTMVYNEAVFLPIWRRHYSRQVGAANCYVIDHGSDDGSTKNLGEVNVLRLPRSPHDDVRRAQFLSRFCTALLGYFSYVLHTDVDEIVAADPARHSSLAAYAASCPFDVVSAVGLNVLHLDEEAAYDPGRGVLSQRSGVMFSSALCKPVLIRRPVQWSPGFHSADAAVQFDDLFLFHLRYFDRTASLARLARTRTMPWADSAAGAHQRVTDTEFLSLLDNFATMDWCRDVAFEITAAPMRDCIEAVCRSQIGRESDTYRIDLQLNRYEIWPIPARFTGIF
jgi:hypothetical protein